jgi:hypothetical protein
LVKMTIKDWFFLRNQNFLQIITRLV